MNKFYNKYYIDFPIYLHSFEILKGKKEAEFTFFNVNSGMIESIEIMFYDKKLTLNIDSKDEVITHKIDVESDLNTSFKPEIYACVVEGKEYILDDFKDDTFTISIPESVYSLGYERYLYTGVISRALKVPKKEIEYVARKNKYFWTCTCGSFNLDSFEECKHCGNHKEKLFSVKVPVETEADKTDINSKLYKSTLIWLILMFAIQLGYQSFYGTFLFENRAINDFFPVFNRFIIPGILIVSNIALVISILYYRRVIKIVSYVVFYGIILYLNLISNIAFVNHAYSLLVLVGVNIMAFGIFRFNFIYRRGMKYNTVLLALALISSVFVGYQWSKFSSFDLIIKSEGLVLNVDVEDEIYTVPDSINNLEVIEVFFNMQKDYNIRELTIGKNIDTILMYSTAVLPYLENIYVDSENSNFYVSDNILYTSDDDIYLVPMAITSLTVNSETIEAGEFRELLNLVELIIGPNVVSIEREAFYNNINLRTITFDDNTIIENIGDKAFYNCQSLETIDLPITIQTLGIGVFERCNNVTSVKVPFIGEEREDNGSLRDSSDVLVYMFGSRTYLESDLIPNALETVEIYDISRIHNVTFYNANYIKSIILPSDLTNIGIRSFYGCESLEEFTVPGEVTIIDESAFEKSGLVTITIPASVAYIDKNAFKDCDNLENVIYEGNINTLIISEIGNSSIIDILYPDA